MSLGHPEIDKALTRFKDLPTLPDVVARVMQIVGNPLTTADDLNQVISLDQALTFKVLRLANSAYYGFPKEITNITQAVTILGFNTIRNLALSVSVHKMLFSDRDKGLFSHRDFWKHCVATAVAARILARRVGYKSEDNAFTAGLLHDIGKSLLDRAAHDDFMRAIQISKDQGLRLHVAERQVFGLDHADVGGRLVEIWNLPADLRAAVARHHAPGGEGPSDVLVAVIHAANELCRQAGHGDSGDHGTAQVEPAATELLGLSATQSPQLLEELAEQMKEAEEFLRFSR